MSGKKKSVVEEEQVAMADAMEQEQGAEEEEMGEETAAEEFGAEETEAGDSSGWTLEEALARLADAEHECRRAQDKLLRVQAEMQNLRRRTEHDIQRAHKFGQEKFSSELLVVMDNLERAVSAAGEHEDEVVKAIHEGVNLTLKSFADCFAKFNIEAVDPHGEPFDPALHQAMTTQENAEVEPNTVIAVMQKGYTLHGRVIRPAMVVVSTEPAQEKGE